LTEENLTMNRNQHKAFGLLIGIMIFFVTAYALFYVWVLVGVLTGVLGMCATSLEGWALCYFALSLLIPVCGIAAGRQASRWYWQRRLSNGE